MRSAAARSNEGAVHVLFELGQLEVQPVRKKNILPQHLPIEVLGVRIEKRPVKVGCFLAVVIKWLEKGVLPALIMGCDVEPPNK